MVLRQLREVEIVRAPAIIGESAVLADTVPAVRTRLVTYRREGGELYPVLVGQNDPNLSEHRLTLSCHCVVMAFRRL